MWPRVLFHDKYLTGEIQALGSSSIKRKRMKVAKRNTGIEREKKKEKRKERRERRKGRRKRRQITVGHTCHPSTKEVEPRQLWASLALREIATFSDTTHALVLGPTPGVLSQPRPWSCFL